MSPESPKPVLRGRLAPSPTGALHLGNARTFLLAWLSIRSRGGQVVLRMEDLDHPKVKPQAAEEALKDLRWLGLDWDEGPDVGGPESPYVQSERIEQYARALARLREQDRVYCCLCSRRDVETAQSAPHAGDEGPRYPGTCRGRYTDFDAARAALPPGRLPAWRFRVSPGAVAFVDGFHGALVQDVYASSGDFVLARHPAGAGYMLAVVVDDAAMNITEVLRADDLLPATGRQLQVYAALDLPVPEFVHVPLVVGEDGRRLAKRHGDTRIAMLRERGVAPDRVVGLLAWWCGWVPWGTRICPHELLSCFDLRKLPRAPAVLDARARTLLGI